MTEHDDDGYQGPAEVITDTTVIPVEVILAGHFEPIEGAYRWYGRVAAEPRLAELVGSTVTLRTPQGEVTTTLSDADPWGRLRVEGFGSAPFEVLTDVREADDVSVSGAE